MAAKVFDSLSDGVYGLLQQREVMARIAQSRILQGTLQVAVLAATLAPDAQHHLGGGAALAIASCVRKPSRLTRASAGAILAGVPFGSIGSLAAGRRTLEVAGRTWTASSCRGCRCSRPPPRASSP